MLSRPGIVFKPLRRIPRDRCSGAAVIEGLLSLAVLASGGGDAHAAQDKAKDAQWTMPSKDYAATRYSALADITPNNAKALHPVWTFSTGVLGGHEGQPLVVGDT